MNLALIRIYQTHIIKFPQFPLIHMHNLFLNFPYFTSSSHTFSNKTFLNKEIHFLENFS